MIMVIKSKSMCMIFCRDFKKLGISVQESCAVKDGNIWNSDLNINKQRIRISCNLYSICIRKYYDIFCMILMVNSMVVFQIGF